MPLVYKWSLIKYVPVVYPIIFISSLLLDTEVSCFETNEIEIQTDNKQAIQRLVADKECGFDLSAAISKWQFHNLMFCPILCKNFFIECAHTKLWITECM